MGVSRIKRELLCRAQWTRKEMGCDEVLYELGDLELTLEGTTPFIQIITKVLGPPLYSSLARLRL